jgi:transposase-like protein
MNRIGNKWSEEEEQRMVKALQQGKSIEQVAKDHQRTVKAIGMRVEYLIRKLSKHASDRELSELFHKTPQEVRSILEAPSPAPSSASTPTPVDSGLEKRLSKMENDIATMTRLVEKIYKKIKNK